MDEVSKTRLGRRTAAWCFLGAVLLSSPAAGGQVEGSKIEEMRVYVGTYTRGKSEGIYLFRLDLESGSMKAEGLAATSENPSFLAIHPDHRFLYAVNEIGRFEEKSSGAVSAFSIDAATGRLTLLNRRASRGAGPCHLVVDKTGRNVLVANYGGGSICALALKGDGRLGEATAFIQHEGSSVNPRRQQGPHAHSINVDPANRFAFAADLGLDKVLVYRFDAVKGSLTPNEPPAARLAPGAGPRHFAFHPSGRFAYVINEMDSTVTAFRSEAERGTLTPIQTVPTLPAGFEGRNSTAEVQVAPSGKYLYGSNRGHDSIVVFAIDPERGTLTYVENEPTRGKTPRNFGIDPSGRFLLAANQGSDTIAVFRIESSTGRLEPTEHLVSVPSPVCVKFVPRP